MNVTVPRFLRLNQKDNVIVAIDAFTPPMEIEGVGVCQGILRGHKMATTAIAPGQPILKFGQVIGFASKAIAPGEWVHEHNVEIVRVASGERSKSEQLGYGGAEFVPWQIGATM
jgi:altronate hydrolase